MKPEVIKALRENRVRERAFKLSLKYPDRPQEENWKEAEYQIDYEDKLRKINNKIDKEIKNDKYNKCHKKRSISK